VIVSEECAVSILRVTENGVSTFSKTSEKTLYLTRFKNPDFQHFSKARRGPKRVKVELRLTL